MECDAIVIHFQSKRFSEVEVAKTKPEEMIAASQVMEDVKKERLQTPYCITAVTCQHKGTTLVISMRACIACKHVFLCYICVCKQHNCTSYTHTRTINYVCTYHRFHVHKIN